jgi:dynamin 1-like protein
MGGGSEVLRIANALEGILGTPAAQGKIKQPEVPRLVVVGTQSSGKSSLLNGIMAADILPLGEQMCTRAPLSLQLVHTPDPSAMRAEFGGFTSGVWAPTETISLQCPDPTAPQLAQIRAAIESQTSARAGAQKGVSHEPIFLRIHSPHVPNLSLVDLPGLTMTALTDQGQPRDIKAQIKRMIGGYIEQERTIILMVCPARMDLEADPALELVKEYDPQGNRTVGVLTKIDLMNAGSDVSRYLANAVPADLQLRHGYFAVRNRAPAEVATATVADGFGLEEAYFAQHPTYAKAGSALRERLGVPPLSRFLARILSDHLRQHLPEISREIHALVAEHEQAIHALGPAVPPDDASKASLLQTLLATFCRDFSGALVEKRADVKTGRKIKDAFVALQANLRDVAPFDASQFSDETLLEACRDCEGNHLSFPIPPIEMIEHMLQHPEQRPIRQLLPACLSCLSTVTDELRALRDRLLQEPAIARFPQLQLRMREEMDGLFAMRQAESEKKLRELVEMEEAYISTDDPAFLAELAAVVKKLVNRMDASLLRSLLVSYYSTVQRALNNGAPKAIMRFLVRGCHESVYGYMFDRIARQPPKDVLAEPEEVETKRRADMETLAKLRVACQALSSLST